MDEQKKTTASQEAFEWAEACIFAVVGFVLIFMFVVRTATVFGQSMVPTLHETERLVMWQMGYNSPNYNEIVIVDRSMSDEEPIIKRVIGKAGDTIDIDFYEGVVYRNGEPLEEPYVNEPTYTYYDVAFPVTVPEGHIFVLGDNRNHSADSRVGAIGMVDLRNVMGRAVVRFFPIKNAEVLA